MIAMEFDRDDAAIDALVDGELSARDRRALLEQLETTPGGWRKCALAFLEAQSWRQGFADAAREVVPNPQPEIRVRSKTLRITPWIARAAVVIVAFGVGWAVRIPRTVMVAETVTPRSQPADLAQKPTAPADYLSGRLEREGYHVERTRGFVPTATKDGRPIAVPVQRTRIRFVGNRSV